jgi:hypothetical protein
LTDFTRVDLEHDTKAKNNCAFMAVIYVIQST